MSKSFPPFTCQYSERVVDILASLKCSITISTYQANKLIFISPTKGGKLVQLARNFEKVMGFQYDDERLVLSTKSEVHLFANSKELAASYPKKPRVYDALFLPRQSFYTGVVDIHDIHLEGEEIYAVNTSFSTIVKLGQHYNWEPIWTPPNISALASEDRCHLNGFCFDGGELVYATSLGDGDHLQSWRKGLPDGGVLWDVQKNEAVLRNLNMPHSPRIYGDSLYFFESAEGRINKMDLKTRKVEVFKKIEAFVRGLAFYGDYMFVGKSKLRATSSIFKHLEMAKKDIKAGIIVIHMPTKAIVGNINYITSVEEIYDVQILPDFVRPNVLSPKDDYHLRSLRIPNSTFWASSE